MSNQIIHLESLEHPGEGVCGIVPNFRMVEYHKIEDMDYIQNSMWPDDILCSQCREHEDYILGILGSVGEEPEGGRPLRFTNGPLQVSDCDGKVFIAGDIHINTVDGKAYIAVDSNTLKEIV